MGRVVIAGCGYVGMRLGEILSAEGHEIWGIRRDPSSLPPAIRHLKADLTDPQSLVRIDLHCDWAVYCAAAEGHTENAYQRAYGIGLRSFLNQLQRSRVHPKRVIFTSSTGVYGQDDGTWVEEESPTEPKDFSGRWVLEGERILRNSGLPGIILRLGGIYGPGRTHLLERIRTGNPSNTEPPTYTNRIHREDCARSLVHLLNIENPFPVYNGVDCQPSTRDAVSAWIAQRMGLKSEITDSPGSGPPRGKRVRNTRLIESGYRFLYPSFKEGYGEMIGRPPSP